MNPTWLRYFAALAETNNYHAAAERLHITPQTLSKAISNLEAELKVVLVERRHRVEGLTAAGEALLEEAKAVLAAHENAERRLAEWRAGAIQGPVAIAGNTLWHHHLLPDVLAGLVAEHPHLRPQLFLMPTEPMEQAVAAGNVDIGLMLGRPKRPDLAWVEGIRSPYVIAGKPQPMGQWRDFGYIVPKLYGREMTESTDGWPKSIKRRVVAEVESLETAIRLCERGVGVAFLPQMVVDDPMHHGRLAKVAEAPFEFADQLVVVWRKDVRPTKAMRVVLKGLRAFLAEGLGAEGALALDTVES